MMRALLFLFFAAPVLTGFSGCVNFSEDHAPGGISATDTGMNVQSVREWQDQTVRRLAY